MNPKSLFPNSASREDELTKCVNCGLCQSICPTYIVKGFEGLTARGKIILMKRLLDGSIEPSSTIADLFDDCLTCYACQTICPAGVKTERLWTAARQDLARWSKIGRMKRLGIRWTIGRPSLFDFGVFLWGMLFGFDRRDHQKARLNGRGFPLFRGAPYLRQLKQEYFPDREPVGSVGLLVGCSGNLSAPWVVDATIRLLTAAGWRVIVPKQQVCCGAPAINNSDWKTARRLAKQNIELFTGLGVDRVTSPDATCAGAMAYDYLEIFADNSEILPSAHRLSRITVDLGNILAEDVAQNRLHFKPLKADVTIHDSCHSTHIGGSSRWRELLGAVGDLSISEMRDSDHCCGFGGSYALVHPKDSVKIARRKMDRADETGARDILVGSPGCLIRLQSVTEERKTSIRVRHISELLADIIE